MFSKIKFSFILLAFTSALFSQQSQMRIAILDLQPVGVSELTAKTVSDLLRTELFKTKMFTVIERQQMNEVLKEQGFQQTGCTETECVVQVGELLSAHKVLVGTVNKLGETFIINARIVDVEKGIMEFGESTKVTSESELDNGCKIFAQKLASMIKGETVIEEKPKAIEEKPEPVKKKKYIYPMRTLGYISSGIGIVSLGLGYYFNSEAEKNYNDSLKLYDEYSKATTDFDIKWSAYKEKYDLSKSQMQTRNILYITSGVTITFGIISTFIIRKPIEEKVSIQIAPNKIWLAYKF